MSEENKEKEPDKDPDFSAKADELINKGKKLADKAEDFITDKANQVKASEAFGKFSHFMGSVGDFLDQKSEELHSGEMGEKFEAFKEKTEGQVTDIIQKVKVAGLKIGDAVDEQIDALKGKKDKTGNRDGAGI